MSTYCQTFIPASPIHPTQSCNTTRYSPWSNARKFIYVLLAFLRNLPNQSIPYSLFSSKCLVSLLKIRQAAGSNLLDTSLSRNNVLQNCQDMGPIFKFCEWNALFCTTGDEIYY